jgi:hypothetical protein
MGTFFESIKFNDFDRLLQPSTFVVRPARYAFEGIFDCSSVLLGAATAVTPQSISQGRRAFCGSLLISSAT